MEGATTYLVYRQYEGEERDNSSVASVATSGATGVVVADQASCSTATYHVQPATATLGDGGSAREGLGRLCAGGGSFAGSW